MIWIQGAFDIFVTIIVNPKLQVVTARKHIFDKLWFVYFLLLVSEHKYTLGAIFPYARLPLRESSEVH